MSGQYRLLVFDWDGTLMDSEARIVACVSAAIADVGLPSLEYERIANIIGLSLREAITSLFHDAEPDIVEGFVRRYRHHYFSDKHATSALFPGSLEVLESLQGSGYLLAVATGKGRIGLDKSLDETGCTSFFDITRCADETVSKPHPQMLLEIMAELDTQPQQTLMIGDTEYDLQMAKQAGVGAVAVDYGVHDRDRLLAYNPLACLGDISELLEWLDK